MVCGVASASMLCVATPAILVVHAVEAQKATDTGTVATHGPQQAPQPVSQEGRLIAVSGDSMTARSANGYTQTYLVTPKTTVITNGGRQPITATRHFTVNDEVDIVEQFRAVPRWPPLWLTATMGHGDGPRMDHVEGQPVSAAPGNA